MKKTSKSIFLSTPYIIVVLFLIVVPIFMMILYSFHDAANTNTFQINFTTSNYTNFLKETVLVKKLFKSVYLALIVTFITLLLGYPLAYIISKKTVKMQAFAISLISAPILINLLIKVLSIKQLIEIINPNLIGSDFAMIFGFSYIYLPFMVIPIYENPKIIAKSLPIKNG